MNNGGRLRRCFPKRINVSHDVMTKLFFVLCRLFKVNIIQMLGHLIDLTLPDIQSKLFFGLGQFQPESSPGAEFLLSAEQFVHDAGSVTLDQRAGINVVGHSVS